MPKKSCLYCNKTYTRLSYYKRHVLLCEMVHSSKFEKNMNIEENQTLYSYSDLVNVVQELKYEFVKMQDEFKKLKKENTSLKQKPIKVKEHEDVTYERENVETPYTWLESNKQSLDINKWINDLKLNSKHLNYLDDSTVYELLFNLLENKSIPVYIINDKYYCYIETQWSEISFDNLNNYYQKILSNIWKIFLEWQNENVTKIKINDDYQKMYHTRLQNICNKNNKYIKQIKDKIIEKIKI
mgnify:CR=1 FL=1|jgi:hypothetical protein